MDRIDLPYLLDVDLDILPDKKSDWRVGGGGRRRGDEKWWSVKEKAATTLPAKWRNGDDDDNGCMVVDRQEWQWRQRGYSPAAHSTFALIFVNRQKTGMTMRWWWRGRGCGMGLHDDDNAQPSHPSSITTYFLGGAARITETKFCVIFFWRSSSSSESNPFLKFRVKDRMLISLMILCESGCQPNPDDGRAQRRFPPESKKEDRVLCSRLKPIRDTQHARCAWLEEHDVRIKYPDFFENHQFHVIHCVTLAYILIFENYY